ncbi:MAG: serine/threonine protein kinase [Myxococcales bacterium]|nr:serine/threonine protein kinase [Myxococcales bacterium]
MPVQEAEAEDAMIGQIVGGRYRVTGVLGEGGMGVVYIGEQQMGSTVRKVAIKTLHPHLSKDPSVLARFHRECGTVAQLEHPNTIKFYDFGSTADGTLYIAMEFVKGEPLMDVIEKGGPMAPDRVLKIMKQVCGALDEAHKQGIIHRDLKPENIILTDRAGEKDFVKVLDFGIAARSESADAQKEQKLTQQGMVLGTPPYMSPEQFTGKALDMRSDIYSLGVMTYEMLTARLPFEADTPWQWATQHMTAQPLPFEATAPATNIPEPMRKAILRSLSKDREDRQGTAKEFFSDLSSGGGITVDEVAPQSLGSAGTAAMAAAPDFAAISAGGGGGPASPAPMSPPVHAPAMQHSPPAVAVPPPPPATGKSGGGKGLIFGLAGVGAILLIGIVVVAARQMKSDSNDDQPLTNPFTSASSGQTSIAPQVDPASSGSANTPDTPDTPDTTPTANTSKPPTTNTGSKPPTTNTGSKPPVSNTAACDSCISAAQSGNISGAASYYRSCTDAGKKASCSARARAAAPAAAKRAALNGQCGQAKAIIGAANAMGASSGQLSGALNGTSCK